MGFARNALAWCPVWTLTVVDGSESFTMEPPHVVKLPGCLHRSRQRVPRVLATKALGTPAPPSPPVTTTTMGGIQHLAADHFSTRVCDDVGVVCPAFVPIRVGLPPTVDCRSTWYAGVRDQPLLPRMEDSSAGEFNADL
jgi:hypothetical protein